MKKPGIRNKVNKIKNLGLWITRQKKNYKNKLEIMKHTEIYNKWTVFINNPLYLKYFLSNEEEWNNNLESVKKYIDENNKRPSKHDNNKDIKFLGTWISNQTINYNKKLHIMKTNPEIYDTLTEFINNPLYSKYFLSNEEEWNNNLDKVKKYISENKKRPSNYDKSKDIKFLGTWVSNQTHNYKNKLKIMKHNEIYDKWTNFINDPLYFTD
jgi:hypothetical protein